MATALILRTCRPDGSSSHGFRWPLEPGAVVEAPDWRPTAECGHGLHGFLWGEGDGGLADWSDDAVWLVAEVAEWVDLDGKVKFPRATVRFVGDRLAATDWIIAHGARGRSVIGATATAGHRGTATAGDSGTATAGHRGTATAGYHGTATAGDSGTATAGHYGTATAGDSGTATAGYHGTATAGYSGVLCIHQWDGRRRLRVAYVGENGILPDVPYRLDGAGSFVRAEV